MKLTKNVGKEMRKRRSDYDPPPGWGWSVWEIDGAGTLAREAAKGVARTKAEANAAADAAMAAEESRHAGASHTPGVWSWQAYRSEGSGNCVYVKSHHGNTVASCLNGPCALEPTPTQLADARLIAASPELLQACEFALRLMPHAHALAVDADPRSEAYSCPVDQIPSSYNGCADMLRAAIKKAKGE